MALREELGTIPQVKCQAKNTLTVITYKIGAMKLMITDGSVQSLNHVQLFATPWTAARQASLSITNSQSFLKVMSIESVMPSNPHILCHPLSSHLQSLPATGSFPMNQFFTSGGQSIGVSASASVLPMTIQDWFPSGWTGWISLQLIKRNTPTCCISESNLTFTFYNSLAPQW